MIYHLKEAFPKLSNQSHLFFATTETFFFSLEYVSYLKSILWMPWAQGPCLFE